MGKGQGLEKESAQNALASWQIRWIRYLLAAKQFDRARAGLEALPEETRSAQAAALVPLDLRIAAATKTLDAAIEAWRADPQRVPALDYLRAGAVELQNAGDKSSARKILEFVFTREIEEHQLSAANLLGLAEIRLDSGDTAGAVDLLRRMTLVVGEPFQNLDSAAALLEKTSHSAEAAVFLDQLVRAVPWNPSYRIRLSQALMATGKDAASARSGIEAVAASPAAPYEIRVQAAAALSGGKVSADLGSAELRLLALPESSAPDKANQPFFYFARLEAARHAANDEARIAVLRGALEDNPAGDAARISLFRAALAAKQYQLAHSALAPLLRGGFLRRSPRAEEGGEEESAPDESADAQGFERSRNVSPPDTLGKIPRIEQAAIAAELATVFERLDRLNDAERYLQLGVQLESAPSRRTALRGRLAGVRAILKRQAGNAARRPIIHNALEQDRTVRPQLIAQAAEKTTSPPVEKTAAPLGKPPVKQRRQP